MDGVKPTPAKAAPTKQSGASAPGRAKRNDVILNVENLGVRFGAFDENVRNGGEVVSGVSFTLRRGETVAIVGESGSGKSLTAKSLMGLLPHNAVISRGQALFHDEIAAEFGVENGSLDLFKLPPHQMRQIQGGRIAMIFQEPMSSLSPFHTIGQQVEEALRLHQQVRGRAVKARCLEVFTEVGFPDSNRAYDAYPFELSGGLRQRAMIAMAMVCRPALLLADEPTTALDVSTQALILDLINRLRAENGLSVLLITHDLGVVANAADAVVVMSKGEVVESGRTAEVLKAPGHGYTRRLLAAAPKVADGLDSTSELAVPTALTRTVVLNKITNPEAELETPDFILSGEGVRKTYLSRKGPIWAPSLEIPALVGVDFALQRGKTLALVGESGSGKTTLAKIAMRAEAADPGARLLYKAKGAEEQDLTTMDGEALRAFRREAQIVFQDPYASLSPRMTVQDIITEPLLVHRDALPEYRSRTARRDRAVELIRRVGLDETALGRFPHAFSGGQRQRISIARALALGPKLLVCDEPTSALDVSVQAQVLDLLEELQKEFGLSYLFISHDLAVVARLADEIAVMCRGAIVEQAPTKRLFEAPTHPYTQALIAAAPEPDPSKPLDLAKIAAGAGAEPEKWPEPFGYPRLQPPPMIEVAPEAAPRHLVRQTGLASHIETAA
ncbi:MAG: ABC transporter ATP-binding protein [Rhodobacteraceae bacterium]|nr:ABC transporter ATP-binding protein [Paracoccaceae bacterium]